MIKSQQQYINELINAFSNTQKRMPTDEEISNFKKQYRQFYLREYRKEYRKKTTEIKMTFTNLEDKKFTKVADKFKKKKSTLGKEIILNFLNNKNTVSTDTEKELQETIIQIRKIGANINQLAKLANQQRLSDYKVAFNNGLNLLVELEKVITKTVNKI